MSQSANVRSIEALRELHHAMMRYHYDTLTILDAVRAEIRRTCDWLEERRYYWQNELRRREEYLRRARESLSRCESKSKVGICINERAAVREAQRMVDEATSELRTVKDHINRVNNAINIYQAKANRLKDSLQSELLKGVALLNTSSDILTAYVNVDGISSGVARTVAGASLESTSVAKSIEGSGEPETLGSEPNQGLNHQGEIDERAVAGGEAIEEPSPAEIVQSWVSDLRKVKGPNFNLKVRVLLLILSSMVTWSSLLPVDIDATIQDARTKVTSQFQVTPFPAYTVQENPSIRTQIVNIVVNPYESLLNQIQDGEIKENVRKALDALKEGIQGIDNMLKQREEMRELSINLDELNKSPGEVGERGNTT